MRIQELDGPAFRDALLAGCEYVQHRRAELNRINVFPVPDGDTGTNLALTVGSIAERLRSYESDSVGAIAREAADAGILGARGNCGMILSHYLVGFAESVGARARLSVEEFSGALRAGVNAVYHALERPVEGTILTVMRETAEEAERAPRADFVALIERLVVRARKALARTPDLLPALRAAGVVDAGAKGFVHLLEGVVAYVHGDPIVALEETPDFEPVPSAVARAAYPAESERYRFCTEALVRGAKVGADEVRAALRGRGDSLIVLPGAGVIKVHIHTDDPEAVFAYLRGVGRLAAHKAEDMAVQHEAAERSAAAHRSSVRRPVALVTDSGCDLPEDVLRAHGITVVPLYLVVGDRVLRDRIDIDAATFLDRLAEGVKATTSQPPPAAFLDAYRRASEDGEAVVAVILASALSGTFQSAEAAAKRVPEVPIHLVDSRGASLTQGLLVAKAAELGERGWRPEAIVEELGRIRSQSGLFFTVDTFDRLLASGRVGRGRAWLGTVLDIKPILGLDPSGRIVPVDRVRGRGNVLPRVLSQLARRVPTDAKALRFGIIHVACPEVAEEVREAVLARYGDREVIVSPATPVLATHLGPGAWGLAYQLED